MIPDTLLYLASSDDLHAARVSIAGRPLAFRVVMAAVRAGARRVALPAALRDPALETAIARTPAARAAVVWLSPDTPAPRERVALVPAGTLVTARTLSRLATESDESVLAATTDAGAPVAVVPPDVLTPLWRTLTRGRPAGSELARALATRSVRAIAVDGVLERVPTIAAAADAEARLLATLGSPIDTKLDRAFHRRLSRFVTRWAVARGVTANALTVASIVVGLGSAAAMSIDGGGGALVALALYVVAVVLDHADGEVARVTFAESAFGHWLDVGGDTLVHAALVLAMGFAADRAAGAGVTAGFVAALGVVGSAWAMKTAPATATAVGAYFIALGNRDGFYVMLLAFLAGLIVMPSVLPLLMTIVAAGSHAYWIGSLVSRSRR